MPAQKPKKPVKPAALPAAKSSAKKIATAKPVTTAKAVKPAPAAKPASKARPVPASKPTAKPVAVEAKKAALAPATAAKEAKNQPLPQPWWSPRPVKKKPGRPPKAASPAGDAPVATGAKRGRKPKAAPAAAKAPGDELDMSDIEADLVGEPVPETAEKVKPLRMKISKAKERA